MLNIGQVLFCMFMDRDEVEVHKLTKKRMRPISSHLDQTNLVNIKDLLHGFRGNFSYGIQWVVPNRQDDDDDDGSILPAQVANHSM